MNESYSPSDIFQAARVWTKVNYPQFWLFGHPALIDTQYSWRTLSNCFRIPSNKSAGIVPWIKKECSVLFLIYIYIYLYIYLLKKERNVLHSFAKERNVLTFFAKVCCILCVLFRSLEKNVFLGLIGRQKLKKERKRTLRSFKKRKRTERSEWKRTGAQPCCHLDQIVHIGSYNARGSEIA